jgi:hypothetical protein
LVRRPLTGLLYQPRIIDDECGAVGGMRIGRGNRSTRRKASPTTNPTLPDLRSNTGHRSVKPATNRLSYGKVHPFFLCFKDMSLLASSSFNRKHHPNKREVVLVCVCVCVCLGVTCFNKYDTFMILLINDPAGSWTTCLPNGVVLHISCPACVMNGTSTKNSFWIITTCQLINMKFETLMEDDARILCNSC